MKHIVILGGGFGGISAAKELAKKINPHTAHVTLVDKHPYHLFTPSLYEVATSEEPKQNIAIPLQEVFGKRVQILKDTVESIDTTKQLVKLQGQDLPYDYLVIALGSEPAYFHIPGLKEHSMALKSLREAIMIRNKIKDICCKGDECRKKARVIIGGGGFSGTEIAAELLTYKDRLAKQLHLSPDCLDITIIQGSDRLLNELDPHVSTIATKRLKRPDVHFAFGGHIKEVTDTKVLTDDGKEYGYDLLIWTGGVAANSIAAKSDLPVNKRGQIIVNKFLQVTGLQNVFAIGDIAEYTDEKTKSFAPTVAPIAEDEGTIAGENILHLLTNKPLKSYKIFHWGYVVPIHGRFAAAELMGFFHFDGFLGWLLQQFIFLQYLFHILTPAKALKRWNTFELELEQ